MTAPRLGVCYYPEHWPEDLWARDACHMAELGLSVVRIGEFAWSRIEPEPRRYVWDWLDRAINTLADAGLSVILGTPTATPPKWLIDRHADILATDHHGRPRRFGSRRHYSFSSESYQRECRRIVMALAERYGRHRAVIGWQTDNEYGCHDTVHDHGPLAAEAFRDWLSHRYGTVETLNEAWGTVFWSQEYQSFEEIDPPVGTVTEAHPAHRMDFHRFSSEAVRRFNRAQTDILRRYSPGRDITHNFMGFFADFDHFAVGSDLDLATWDSYPLGFLELGPWSAADKARWLRQGHPDVAAFHHDLYRACGRGRWGVMEQQPGPVNWAPYNPAPLPGMVRLWAWEAIAHGAELVSFFRWRQVPFAQEQMHAGLLAPDSSEDVAAGEVRLLAGDLDRLGPLPETDRAPVALIVDYEAAWATRIQPHGAGFDAMAQAFHYYSALRGLGLDVDILSPADDPAGYALVVAPCLPILSEALTARLAASGAVTILGARTGSRTRDMKIPDGLAPGPAKALLPLQIRRVETLRPGITRAGSVDGQPFEIGLWREDVASDLPPVAMDDDGAGVWYRHGRVHYLAVAPDEGLLRAVLTRALAEARLEGRILPRDLRLRRRGTLQFAFNYGPEALDLASAGGPRDPAAYRLGGPRLEPAGLAAWTIAS